MTPIDQVDSVKLIENGPMRAIIRVTRTWQSSKFVQDITLYAGADTVDVVNDIDWHETHVLLKAAFPLAASAPMATYEIPYGSIQRTTTRNNTWEQAKFEVPAMRWADLGDAQHGFTLLNDSKYAYDGDDNLLRLTLLRSPTWPDPVADQGHHHFSYALYPHGGTWQQALTEREGYQYNYKLRALQVESHTGSQPAERSFLSVEPGERSPHRRQESRRLERPHLPRLRVGRQAIQRHLHPAPRSHLRNRDQPHGEAARRPPARHGQQGHHRDQALRDPLHPRRLPAPDRAGPNKITK